MPVAATVTDKRGLKRSCMSCGARFYDFNKRPIICPGCEAEFTGDMKVKSRRTRTAASMDEYEGKIGKSQGAAAEPEEQEDDVLPEGEESDTVSLDEVEELDEGDDAAEDEVDADLDLDEEEEIEEDLDEEEIEEE